MDPYSSGEDLVIKTRKPYTITKQRERWTEEEHNRFLEALKLHGRAWQRIEEHIGTKTAVQIRSHAQKFFTKLEKEATVKGVPIGHDLDIEIPPPRPKKKPSNPYPRKTSMGDPTSHVAKDGKISNSLSSVCQSKMTVSMEKEPEKPHDDGKLGNSNEYHGKDNCSKAFTLLKIASPSSTNDETSLSVSDAPGKSCDFRQYIPLPKDEGNQDEAAASQVTIESKGPQVEKSDDKKPFQDNAPFNISNAVDSYLSHGKYVHSKRIDELKQSEDVDALTTADVQGSQNYPRHVHVHILDGSPGVSVQTVSPDITYTGSVFHQMGGGSHGHQNLFMNPAEHCSSASGTSSVHQSFPSYHHPIFTPNQNQDDYASSFLNISSTFSSLIVSTLSQNLAAYAAASYAATMWPCVNVEASAEPSTASAGAFQSRHLNSVPSMAGIAAATVAAATAWWGAHGLLPLSPPFHPGFTCSPASEMDCSQGRVVNSDRRENNSHPSLGGQQLEPECSEALHEQRAVLKSPVLSSSDSEASGSAKLNIGLAAAETAKVSETAEVDDDANKSKNQKLVDRSSCGSNTPSSSEVEAEAANGEEEKHMQDNEEQEELDAIHSLGDPFNRRCRSISNINDSWKEVSEEGRLAFRALFSREVLPQSFSPPHMGKKNLINKDNESGKERDEGGLQLDLNGRIWDTCSQEQGMEDNATLIGENNDEGLLNIGLGHSKLKARRTGFKPYKRCSMEAKDSRVSTNCHDEEKCPKRLRVEGEAST